MDNLYAILGVGAGVALMAVLVALFSSELVRTEGFVGIYRRLHWKFSATERQRHPYGY